MFGNPDETLALVFEILLENLESHGIYYFNFQT